MMLRFLLLCFAIFSMAPTFGQESFNIPRADELKPLKKGPIPGFYNTSKIPWGDIESNCVNTTIANGAWFNYRNPKTGSATIQVQVGGPDGNLEDPSIYVGKIVNGKSGQKLKEVKCTRNQGGQKTIGVQLANLQDDIDYVVLIFGKAGTANGRFTIGLWDYINNDFSAGAKTLSADYMGKNAEFTTIGATSDGPQNCFKENEVANTWFKFKATNTQAKVKVGIGKAFGTATGIVMSVWSRTLFPKKCISMSATNVAKEQTIELNDLKIGKEYYISVGGTSKKSLGTFTLSIESTKEQVNEYHITGMFLKNADTPESSVKVELLDKQMNVLKSALTNGQGIFKFEKLPPDENVLVRIAEDNPDYITDIYLMNSQNDIISKGIRVQPGLFGFGKDPFPSNIHLLGPQDYKMSPKKGLVGVTGRLVDEASKLLGFKDVKVNLYDNNRKVIATTNTDQLGKFNFNNVNDGGFSVKFEDQPKNSYAEVVAVDDLNVPFLFATTDQMGPDGFFAFKKLPADEVKLARAKAEDVKIAIPVDFMNVAGGSKVTLKQINFETGSYKILDISFPELNDLAKAMKSKPTMKIRIDGHTDNQGDAAINLKLSEDRAKAVRDYLVKQSIAASRLQFKGFGAAKPVDSNDTEAGRAKNRRVEIEVLE